MNNPSPAVLVECFSGSGDKVCIFQIPIADQAENIFALLRNVQDYIDLENIRDIESLQAVVEDSLIKAKIPFEAGEIFSPAIEEPCVDCFSFCNQECYE